MFGKLLKEKIEELNLINEKISAAKAELSNLESEKAELQNYNEALRIFIDMGQSYIPADSLDELEIKRQKAQDLVVNSLKDGAYKIIHNCQMNNSYKMGKKPSEDIWRRINVFFERIHRPKRKNCHS